MEGEVYLSAGNLGDPTIVALDAETGRLVWEHFAGAPIDSSLAVAGGLVYVALREGKVLALNRSDGTILWEFEADGLLFGSPTVYRGIVYIATWNKIIYALDAATGNLLWNRTVDGRVISSPVVNDQLVAFIATDNHVYVLDAHTGDKRLEYRASQSTGSVAVKGDRVYVAGVTGVIGAIDWTKSNYPLEERIRAVRLHLYALGFADDYPLRKGSGWTVRHFGESLLGTPAVADGMVYVTSESGKVFKVDGSDGELVWRFATGSGSAASDSVTVTSDYVVVGDADGRVHVIDVETGISARQFEVDGPIADAPVMTNDTLYVSTTNGRLYAIK